MKTIIGIGIILLIGFLLVVINLIRIENNRENFNKIMKPGDEVKIPIHDYVSGEILEVDGDEVKVVIKVSKSIVYPNK